MTCSKLFFNLAILFIIIQITTFIKAQKVGDQLPTLAFTEQMYGSPDEVGKWGDGKICLVEF